MRPVTRNAVGALVGIAFGAVPAALFAGLPPPWPRDLDSVLYPACLILGPLFALIGFVVATLPLDPARKGIGSIAVGRTLTLVGAGVVAFAIWVAIGLYYGGPCIAVPIAAFGLLPLGYGVSILRAPDVR